MNKRENYNANIELGEKQDKLIKQLKKKLANNNITDYNYGIISSDNEITLQGIYIYKKKYYT